MPCLLCLRTRYLKCFILSLTFLLHFFQTLSLKVVGFSVCVWFTWTWNVITNILDVNGSQSEDANWTENVAWKMRKYWHQQASFGCSINIYKGKSTYFCASLYTFLLRILASQGAVMFSALYQWREEKGWLVTYLKVTILLLHNRALIVYDVTETDCRAQNDSTHGRVFTTLNVEF